MEDSGIDSEDKISTKNYEYNMNQEKHNELQESNDDDDEDDDDDSSNNVEVIFKHPGNKNYKIDSTKKIISSSKISPIRTNNQLSTCKILQRKLELKVERAKRNYNLYQEENAKKTKSSSTLIPINRLRIPGYTDNQPLVEYKSDSEDTEEISFFPTNKSKRQELTDTFSIQEMSIESDNSDDSESQNLELLPPSKNRILDKLLNCFYCSSENPT